MPRPSDSPRSALIPDTVQAAPPPMARRILSVECGISALVLALGIVGLVQAATHTGLHHRAAWILGGLHGAMIAVALIGMTRIILQPRETLDPASEDPTV